MVLKQADKIIDEMSKELFFVEGEVTDLLTNETLQNLNANGQNTTDAIAVGSALGVQLWRVLLPAMTV